MRKAVSDEISYNYLFTLNPELEPSMMPIQIPIVLPEGFYKKNEWGLDPDIMEYQIGALMIQPHIDEKVQSKLKDLITKIGLDMLKDIPEETTIDFQGVLRLAKSWARLQFKWDLHEDDFIKMKNDLVEPFKEFFDLVEDAKKTGKTFQAPLTQLPDKRTISFYATKIFQAAKQIAKETGSKRFPKTTLREKISNKYVSNYDFEYGLDELVQTGYLLIHKNGTEFEITI